jgi:pre-mRNA-splicing helicase BRR2
MSKEQFALMVNMGKAMDDYFDGSMQTTQGETASNNQQQREDMDDDMGVAVVFDDSEEENEDGANKLLQEGSEPEEDEVVDIESESSSEDDNAATVTDVLEPSLAGNESDNEVVLKATLDSGDASAEIMSRSSKRRKHSHQRILTVHEIDAHYLQRQLSKYYDDASQCANIAQEVLDILDISREKSNDLRECENKLLVLLESELFDVIKLILNNRIKIWACISLKRAKDDSERDTIESVLKNEPSGEGMRIWEEIHSKSRADDWTRERIRGLTESLQNNSRKEDGVNKLKGVSEALDSVDKKSSLDQTNVMDVDEIKPDIDAPIELDLDSLAFRDGAHTMSNKKCDLPDQTWRAMKKGYEEVHVPATRSSLSSDEKLIAINELPVWTRDAFKGMDKLNRIQSKMCDVALRSSENILLCAPTGAGKTNIAMLAVLNILGQYRTVSDTVSDDGANNPEKYDRNSFKIVYVAPMKALVQEVVKNFSKRLEPYGILVKELSGDSSLTRQQIADTQFLVTTPEKWDIVTRQGEGRAYTQLVKLVIIDEIHLLHDDRGPVLESIVSRVIRQVETNAEPIRLVGLSATLPNYSDVAMFLRVKPDKGLFFFDQSYRPVPLQMQYIGITERSAFKRYQLQNEICYEKVLSQRRQGNQVLIFVHSRAETGKTAKILKDLAVERDELTNFVRDGGASQEILREESASVKNSDLKEVIHYGFAIHHAGMVRSDRELVEDLFADGHIGVLCSTATLAWGVNLPAHAVIIKGTQIYDPSKGSWVELSPLDVLQMLGRAGA